ncbi:hypothetical protein B0H10DRAFT_407701 [Mycena sp. CBHHK59/15]|nr:hypothetical protein B0H10DRAFT_407701 [Mycena sp. CBHHK59/15]
MNVLHFCQLAQARLASVPPSAPLLARSDSQQRASASSPDDPVPRMPSCQRDARNFQSKTSTAKQVNRGSSRRRSASHPGGRPTAASNSTAHPGPASMVPEPDRTVRPDDALLDRLDDAVRSRNAHDALDREIAALGSKIDAFTAEKQALLQQVQLEASNAHHVDQHQTPLPVLRPPHVGHNHGHLLEDYDGEMSMDLATPLFPTVLLAGSSDVDNTGFAEPPSSSVPADISPLDLTSTVPLPARPPSTSLHAAGDPPWGPTDTQSGEAAVQELMNIAATTARRGS